MNSTRFHLFRKDRLKVCTSEQRERNSAEELRFQINQCPEGTGNRFAPTNAEMMNRRTYCVYNQTRECFLSLGVTPADTIMARLKGLIGKLKLKLDEGLWVVPSQGVHTLGVLFPLDLIYLNESHQVIHVIEHFPKFRIAPLRIKAASVLELPTHTIYSSQTQPGDQLIICAVEEIASRLNRVTVVKLESQMQ
jgi:uncharacterized protein